MNQIPPRDRTAEEIARIREVVEQRALPAFITGFDVRLGEFDGDPATWILFNSEPLLDASESSIIERSHQMNKVAHDVRRAILEDPLARFPYFRFPEPDSAAHPGQ